MSNMADTAKVIRIELRVGGGGSGTTKRKSETEKALDNMTKKNQLAIGGAITIATQLLSQGFKAEEIFEGGSIEKSIKHDLSLGKMAVSTALISGGFALGGVIGGALSIATNQFLVEPLFKGANINLERHLDQTRATNRFYQTSFGGQGNYVFNYSSGSYINEDLQKVNKGSFYKKGSVI